MRQHVGVGETVAYDLARGADDIVGVVAENVCRFDVGHEACVEEQVAELVSRSGQRVGHVGNLEMVRCLL